MPDLSAGDWYGCEGCGRDVCSACGRAAGRRCGECGGTLELNRFFAKVIRPCGEWRDFIVEDDELGPQVYSAGLIALVTEQSLPEIDRGLSEACRALFVHDVLSLEVRRRLGTLDYLVVPLGAPRELRVTPEWKQSLRLAADYYVSRGPPRLAQDFELAEALEGLRSFQPLAGPRMGPLNAALRSRSELVREELLVFLQALPSLPRERFWSEVLPLLCSGQREEGLFGLKVLHVGLGGSGYAPDGSLQDQVGERVLHGLAQASETQLGAVWKAVVSRTTGGSRNLTALLVDALGLVPEVLPLLLQPQMGRHLQDEALRFLGDLREAAEEAVPRLLELTREPSKTGRPLLIRVLGQVGAGDRGALAFLREQLGQGGLADRLAAFTTLLELHNAGRMEWSEPLAQGGLAVVREALAQEKFIWIIQSLDGFPSAWRRRALPGLEALERTLLERLAEHEEFPSPVVSLRRETLRRVLLASPPLKARLLEYARTHTNDGVSLEILAAVGPETPAALLLIQRLLQERDCHPFHRQGVVALLGPFVGEHSSAAEELLLGLFLDDNEDVETRWHAAKALAPAAGRLQGSAWLLPALQDEAALIRGWAYLLLGEHRAVHAHELARDPSPAVRQLVVP